MIQLHHYAVWGVQQYTALAIALPMAYTLRRFLKRRLYARFDVKRYGK